METFLLICYSVIGVVVLSIVGLHLFGDKYCYYCGGKLNAEEKNVLIDGRCTCISCLDVLNKQEK